MITNTQAIFGHLIGNWTFERQIHDQNLGAIHQAIGRVTFCTIENQNPNTLLYNEEGTVTMGNDKAKANFKREYIYQLFNDEIHIILNDGVTKGQLFQTLIPSRNEDHFIGTEHICKLDRHNGKYAFLSPSAFRTEFTVIGPNTNLRIESEFKKLRT